jgi:hypothetical protein
VAVLPSVTAASRGRDGSGGVRELGINSPGVFQLRKEEIEVEDLIGDKQGRRRRRWLEEGGSPNTRARDVSDGQTDSSPRA